MIPYNICEIMIEIKTKSIHNNTHDNNDVKNYVK